MIGFARPGWATASRWSMLHIQCPDWVGRVSSLLAHAVIRPAASAAARPRDDESRERQVSEWTGRSPGKRWPAAIGSRRHSFAKSERLLAVVLTCPSSLRSSLGKSDEQAQAAPRAYRSSSWRDVVRDRCCSTIAFAKLLTAEPMDPSFGSSETESAPASLDHASLAALELNDPVDSDWCGTRRCNRWSSRALIRHNGSLLRPWPLTTRADASASTPHPLSFSANVCRHRLRSAFRGLSRLPCLDSARTLRCTCGLA